MGRCVRSVPKTVSPSYDNTRSNCPAPHQIEGGAENDCGGEGCLRSLLTQVVGQDAPAIGPASRQDGAVGVALPHPGNDFPDGTKSWMNRVLCVRDMAF